MTTNLRTKLNVAFEWLYRDIDAVSSREVTDSNSITFVDTLTNGVVIDTADVIWDSRATVNDGADTDLDLAASLTSVFGTTITFAKVKGLVVVNRNTTAAENLIVGGGSNPFLSWLGSGTDTVIVGPGGCFLIWNPSLAGYAVTAGTGDILRLTGSGGDITYDIAIVGTST